MPTVSLVHMIEASRVGAIGAIILMNFAFQLHIDTEFCLNKAVIILQALRAH